MPRPPKARACKSRPARAARPQRRRAAGPVPIVFQFGRVTRPCPRHGLRASLTALDRSPKLASGSLMGSGPLAARAGPMSRPTPGRSARRSARGRSLRQGRQGDIVEIIAPDAAALRSRHVARRMDRFGFREMRLHRASSCTVL